MLRDTATETVRLSLRVSATGGGRRKFGVVAKALWPEKTADELAFRTGASKRTVERWLDGTGVPWGRAIAAVLAEMV